MLFDRQTHHVESITWSRRRWPGRWAGRRWIKHDPRWPCRRGCTPTATTQNNMPESRVTSNHKNKKSSEDVQKKYDGDEVSELVQWIDNQIATLYIWTVRWVNSSGLPARTFQHAAVCKRFGCKFLFYSVFSWIFAGWFKKKKKLACVFSVK